MFRHATRAVVGCAALLLLAAPAARAQWSPSFVAKAGATIPVGNFGDANSLGYNVGVGGEFTQPRSPVGLRLEVEFHENAFKDDFAFFDDEKFRTLSLLGNLVYAQNRNEGVFLIGGAGAYRGYVPDSDADSQTSFGINGGIGYRFGLSGFSTFVEARFHNIFNKSEIYGSSSTQMIPISFGVRF